MTRVFRQLNELRQLQEQTNDVTDSRQSLIVDSMAQRILLPGDVLTFERSRAEAVLFTSGFFPGFTVNCLHAVIRGTPGAVINGIVRVETTCTLENLHFKSTGNESNALRLVEVADEGIAILKNCTFERKYDDAFSVVPADGYAHLAVLLGGKAKAFNCTFTSDRADGVMNGVGLYAWSDAANAATHLDVVASYNPTTHTLQNGTATAVIT